MRVCWLPLLLLVAGTTFAQSQPVQPCPTDALDATFQALEGPDHSYGLALNIRNITGEACWIAAYPGGTGMVPDPDSSGAWVKICYHCEENGRGPSDARITLAPGEYAHQTRIWNTLPVQPASKCVSMTEMSWDWSFESNSRFWLFSPSLLKPICSQLSTTDYAAGEFLLDSVASLEPGRREPLILWANDQSIDYTRDNIPLRVTVEDPGHLLILDQRSCPQLFVRVRDATPSRSAFYRATRVDEIQITKCRVEGAGAAGTRYVMDFDVSHVLGQKHDENKGEYTLSVSSLAKLKGRYLLLGATDGLHLSKVNDKLVRRHWGSQVEGVAVSLTLEKDIYELGSDVPLHIALENVSSRAVIFAMDPYYDPPGVSVELQDGSGNSIPFDSSGWMGHGFCHSFLPGVVFPIELTLSQMGFRPDRPGDYTVVATWRPSRAGGCFFTGTTAEPLAVRSSPVTFRMVDRAAAPKATEADSLNISQR